ncbi:MAG: hypothetical protein GX182_07010 [Firmicutes bacterium]|nr:hypothetical protein [Bacillota bacterium]
MDLAIQGLSFFHGRLPENSIILATVLKVAGDEVLLELPGGKLTCRTQINLTPGETLLMQIKDAPEGATLQIMARGGEVPGPPPGTLTDAAHGLLTSLIAQRVPPDSPLTQELIAHLSQSSPAPGEIPAILHLIREELPVDPRTIKALASYYHPRPSLTECLVDLAQRLESLPIAPKEPLLAAIKSILSQGLDPISLENHGAEVLGESQAGPKPAPADRPFVEASTPAAVTDAQHEAADPPSLVSDHQDKASGAFPEASSHQEGMLGAPQPSDHQGRSPGVLPGDKAPDKPPAAMDDNREAPHPPASHREEGTPAAPDPIVRSGEALKGLLRAMGVDHEGQLLQGSPAETMKGELLRLLQADLPPDIRRAAEEVLARLDVQQLLPGTRASFDGPLFLAHFEFPVNHEGRPQDVRVTLQGKGPGAEGILRLHFLLEANHLGTLEFELIFNGKKVSCTTRAKDGGALAFLQDRAEHWPKLFEGLGYELIHHRFRLAAAREEGRFGRVDIKA